MTKTLTLALSRESQPNTHNAFWTSKAQPQQCFIGVSATHTA